eukprot:GHVR01103754.1.p1 GENE.GHVR01103754.1~~GHVR01103754.1.p1  ORF type:complete len:156 (+),score=17.36 GHVR01103754.1:33-500(+)
MACCSFATKPKSVALDKYLLLILIRYELRSMFIGLIHRDFRKWEIYLSKTEISGCYLCKDFKIKIATKVGNYLSNIPIEKGSIEFGTIAALIDNVHNNDMGMASSMSKRVGKRKEGKKGYKGNNTGYHTFNSKRQQGERRKDNNQNNTNEDKGGQ